MLFVKGNKYPNSIFTCFSYIMYNAKIIGLFVSVPSVLYWLDKYTSSNSFGAGEYLFWYSALFIVSVVLFFIDKRWIKLCDAILDFIAK